MELFDEVVIEGTGENSRLVAKDTVQDERFVLNEQEVMPSILPFAPRGSVVTVEDGTKRLRSRIIFTDIKMAKALVKDIADKAVEVSKAKRYQAPPGL